MSAEVKAISDPLPMPEPITVEAVNGLIKSVDSNLVSDGYHTFGELYEHRIVNYMALCKFLSIHETNNHYVWMSRKHSNGSIWDGWFILGIDTAPGNQITYHLPESKWAECRVFADEIEQAPEWDGHTSEQVLQRIDNL